MDVGGVDDERCGPLSLWQTVFIEELGIYRIGDLFKTKAEALEEFMKWMNENPYRRFSKNIEQGEDITKFIDKVYNSDPGAVMKTNFRFIVIAH